MFKRIFLPLLFGLGGAAILISLGTWQLQRLAWKEAILAEIDTTITAAPVPVPEAPTQDADQYLPVTATGTITDQEIQILGSVKKIGPGYRIVSAFESEDGRRLLLDRGWVALEAKNASRPPVQAQITGNLHWPDEMTSSTPEPDLVAGIWFGRDIPAMAAHLNTEPVLIVLRETSETEQVTAPFPLDSSGIPNDHLEYVLTWFGLAIVWLGMTAFLLWRINRKTL
ncbi:SURF1 family protein [Pseudoruegeria sp. SHC-113]|uniref:SURF1 family protein n=1 Tax=Pseudoruegeria sp. SHC-113 TaxID=2855439 RepID=UPI0021BB2EEE|nr:SURF1 family protein [Pseudoruegeria sp. SHC-113]MCT8161349.1 SURF1 family protein [Pseudoruegeria sp. SHC-113]